MKLLSKHLRALVTILATTSMSLHAQTNYSGPLLVVPEAKGHRLVLVNPTSKSIVGSIHVPGWPHEIAFSKDGRTAYVPSYSDAIVGHPGIDGQTIDIINMQTGSVITSWDLGKPLRPHKPMLLDDNTLLVTTELANSLSLIDINTGKITAQIPTGAPQSHVFVKTSNSKKLYTANLHPGSVSVIDLLSRRLSKVIPVSDLIQRIALSKDEHWLFVTDAKSQNIVVIDTASDTIAHTILTAEPPFSLHLSPDGRWLLVGEDDGTKGKLEAIDLQDLIVHHTFDTDRLPYGIATYKDEALIACYLSGNLDVLNLATWTLEPPILNVAHGDGINLWNGPKE